jgi:Family of unknown function (DUF5989)
MLKKRGKIARGFLMIASALPSIGGFVRGLWSSKGGRKWLAPLVVFLCVTGLVLVLAATVEALAPFIYTIF